MANNASTFEFSIRGEFDQNKLEEIINAAFEDSTYGVHEYSEDGNELDYTDILFEETNAEYDEYKDIALQLKDDLANAFENCEFKIHARWSSLSGEGMTDYECEFKNGVLIQADVDSPNDITNITCPDCDEELTPAIDTGSIYGIETLRCQKKIGGVDEWKCPECGRNFNFKQIMELINEMAPENSYILS